MNGWAALTIIVVVFICAVLFEEWMTYRLKMEKLRKD